MIPLVLGMAFASVASLTYLISMIGRSEKHQAYEVDAVITITLAVMMVCLGFALDDRINTPKAACQTLEAK